VLGSSLVLALSIAMATNGVNPAAVIGQTIAQANPEIFQQEIYKAAFTGFGLSEDLVQGSLRHEIFGSVLLSMLIATWAMRTGTPLTGWDRRAYLAGMGLGVSLLTLSLSRSILIAALVWPLVAVLRSLRRGELTNRQIGILFGSMGVAGVLLVSGGGRVIYNRFFTDTTGYETRAGNYGDSIAALPDFWVLGGYVTRPGESSHNFLLDTLIRHGIFAALPAAMILLFLLFTFFWMASRLHLFSAAMVPVVAALALPLVRLGTAGGGLIPPIEWVVLAFVFGVLAASRVRTRATAELDVVAGQAGSEPGLDKLRSSGRFRVNATS